MYCCSWRHSWSDFSLLFHSSFGSAVSWECTITSLSLSETLMYIKGLVIFFPHSSYWQLMTYLLPILTIHTQRKWERQRERKRHTPHHHYHHHTPTCPHCSLFSFLHSAILLLSMRILYARLVLVPQILILKTFSILGSSQRNNQHISRR